MEKDWYEMESPAHFLGPESEGLWVLDREVVGCDSSATREATAASGQGPALICQGPRTRSSEREPGATASRSLSKGPELLGGAFPGVSLRMLVDSTG